MKNIILTAVLAFAFANMVSAQSVLGTWKTIDDTDGVEKSHIEIYEKDGKVYGKVIKLLEGATATHCENCEGDQKGAPITGMVILKDLEAEDDYYEDGEILDPATGKVYSCWIQLEDKDKLKVRGFLGFSVLGRTQYWYRVN